MICRKKILLVNIFLFALLLVRVVNVNADEFYERGGDNNDGYGYRGAFSYCAVGGVMPYVYSSLPSSCTQDGCITYNGDDVVGYTTEAIQAFDYDGLVALSNDFRDISVPPNTPIDFVSFIHNGTGHSVHIESVRANLSEYYRTDSVTYVHDSDLGNFNRLGANASILTTPILAVTDLGGGSYDYSYRDYASYQIEHLIDVDLNDGEYVNEVAYSFNTIQPMLLVGDESSVEAIAVGSEATLTYSIVVQNVSAYVLDDIEVTVTTPYSSSVSLDDGSTFVAGEKKTYAYEVAGAYDPDDSDATAMIAITDPNSHTESAGIVTNFIERDDVDDGDPGHVSAPTGWLSWQPTDQVHTWLMNEGERSNNEITLLPYVAYGEVAGVITDNTPTSTPTATPTPISAVLPTTGNVGATLFVVGLVIVIMGIGVLLVL
ncbi:hypothetical protein KC614_00475 [candidate division WWE3 bacterium]|uniref:DUF11 domain-containing protein n=1 Tax=candidate division WWE3 bacterium TaxID=2053526 RepID=A0A955LK43_UNCKA|nr:hypothetical protein [candidate division WWE3 bacterium]